VSWDNHNSLVSSLYEGFIEISDAFYRSVGALISPVNPSGIICDDPRTPPPNVMRIDSIMDYVSIAYMTVILAILGTQC
jgi:hypothetical protein